MQRVDLMRRLLTDPTFQLRLALTVVGVFCIVRAIRYGLGREPLPRAIDFLTSDISVTVYAVAWLAAGLTAFASIVKVWPGGTFPCILLCLAFAFGYTVSWLSADPGTMASADYVGASNYWTVLLLLTVGYFPFRVLLARRDAR